MVIVMPAPTAPHARIEIDKAVDVAAIWRRHSAVGTRSLHHRRAWTALGPMPELLPGARPRAVRLPLPDSRPLAHRPMPKFRRPVGLARHRRGRGCGCLHRWPLSEARRLWRHPGRFADARPWPS